MQVKSLMKDYLTPVSEIVEDRLGGIFGKRMLLMELNL